ncbi:MULTISPECIES: hypothetical protein [Paraburkholderia]|uniref:hypothetical protein n=1 Tax=Paraburkholderia TaxID=1822464 RepID=UPI00116000A4|nr:hypothetical protein [Paraburkholderia fungorum]
MKTRSRYIHTLKSVPRLLAPPRFLTEVMHIDGTPRLTFEGLARGARSVILEFIRRAPTSKREEFDYTNDYPNLLRMPLAPNMWIRNPEVLTTDTTHLYLNGFFIEREQQRLHPTTPITGPQK